MATAIDNSDDSATRFGLIEMDASPMPEWARDAIEALSTVTTTDGIAAIVTPLRAQPEGPAKVAVRAAKDAAAKRIGTAAGKVADALYAQPYPVTTQTYDKGAKAIAAELSAKPAAPSTYPHSGRWIPMAGGGFQAVVMGPPIAVGARLRVVTKGGRSSYQRVTAVVRTKPNGEHICNVVPEADWVEPTAPIAPSLPSAANVAIVAEMVKHGLANEADILPMARAMDAHDSGGTLEGNLADIASQGASNAAVHAAGSMAGGQLGGVGFTSAAGYLTALTHGVKQATADEYKSILRTRYSYTEVEISEIAVKIIPESGLPVGEGIVHAPAVNAMDLTKEQRKTLWGNKASHATARQAVALLKTGDLIMGSIAAGQGASVSWSRARHAVSIPASKLYEALDSIGRSDIAPRIKSTKAQFGDVMGSLNHNGLTARAATKAEAMKQGSGWNNTIVSRWVVGTMDFAADLGSLGDKMLVAELTEGGEIKFQGNESLAVRVRNAFEARVASNVYDSTDLIQWFERVLRKVHHGVTWGGMVYVPAGEVATVKELVAAVKELMGRSFAVACVTTEEGLIAGLAEGLTDEVIEIEIRLAKAQDDAAARERAKAKTSGYDDAAQELAARRATVLSARASTLLRECGDIAERVTGYTTMLGEAVTAQARIKLAALRSVLEPLVDDSSARFAALDLE